MGQAPKTLSQIFFDSGVGALIEECRKRAREANEKVLADRDSQIKKLWRESSLKTFSAWVAVTNYFGVSGFGPGAAKSVLEQIQALTSQRDAAHRRADTAEAQHSAAFQAHMAICSRPILYDSSIFRSTSFGGLLGTLGTTRSADSIENEKLRGESQALHKAISDLKSANTAEEMRRKLTIAERDEANRMNENQRLTIIKQRAQIGAFKKVVDNPAGETVSSVCMNNPEGVYVSQ